MSKKSIEQRIANSRERSIRVNVDVLALGASVLDKKEALLGIKNDIERSDGTWVDVPYSRAKSYFDAIELMIIRKGVRTFGQKLIELKQMEGVLVMTKFGEVVMQKLNANIWRKLQGNGPATTASGLIIP